MKRHIKKYLTNVLGLRTKKVAPLSLSIAAVMLTGATAQGAATLVDGGSIGLGGGTDDTFVSVTSGSSGFSVAGAGSLTSFNGAIHDYAFYDTNTDGAAPTIIGTQGLIGGISDVAGNDDKVALWTASDPSTDPADTSSVGVRWADNATITVDISGLISGSIYVFNGSWQARSDWLELSMTGSGQTPVTTHSGGDTVFALSPAATGVLMNAKRVDFTDASAYDTLTITLQESGGNSAYFGGVVISNVTAIPEPSTIALIGLGGLALILRRCK